MQATGALTVAALHYMHNLLCCALLNDHPQNKSCQILFQMDLQSSLHLKKQVYIKSHNIRTNCKCDNKTMFSIDISLHRDQRVQYSVNFFFYKLKAGEQFWEVKPKFLD